MPREEPGGTWGNLRAHGTWRSDGTFLHMDILLFFVFCDIVGKTLREAPSPMIKSYASMLFAEKAAVAECTHDRKDRNRCVGRMMKDVRRPALTPYLPVDIFS
jgi:hypothetical protein